MTPGTSTTGLTRLDDQHPDVFPSSPNALLGVFTSVLQARFYTQAGSLDPASGADLALPWVWTADATPRDDGAGPSADEDPGEAQAQRRIYIEAGPLENPPARNLRPALIVDRGPIQLVSLGAGNRVHVEYPLRAEMLLCHGQVGIEVGCIARDSGESAALADIVASYLAGSTPDIRDVFGIHEIGLPQIGVTGPYARVPGELASWRTSVSFPVTIIYKWLRWPLAPVLREFAGKLRTEGEARDLREVLHRR